MAKYQTRGVLDHVSKHSGTYGHVPSVDFRSALELVSTAENNFAELPSELRAKFKNSPAEFLAFCENPDNRSEMALLGLLNEEATAAAAAAVAPPDSTTEAVSITPATTDAE